MAIIIRAQAIAILGLCVAADSVNPAKANTAPLYRVDRGRFLLPQLMPEYLERGPAWQYPLLRPKTCPDYVFVVMRQMTTASASLNTPKQTGEGFQGMNLAELHKALDHVPLFTERMQEAGLWRDDAFGLFVINDFELSSSYASEE